jgi:two-component system NtrC family sensor kinase
MASSSSPTESAEATASRGSPLGLVAEILLIDDSPIVLETVGSLFQTWGHKVVTAERADAGLVALEHTAFDIVVADVRMPGMDGLELLAAIRTRAPELPVIMLSSTTDMGIVLRAIHDGAFDYVNKDDGLEALGSAIRRALEHARLVRENRRLVDELRRMNLSLEEKVHDRTVELEEVNLRLSTERSELARTLDALRHTQSQLIQAEKMATIGLFTAGIAHEINNPLAFLLPDFDEVQRWVTAYREGRDPDAIMNVDDLEQLLTDCRHGLLRIGRIVKQISVFAHQSAHEVERVEVAPLVSVAFRMLEKEAQRARADLVTAVDPAALVRADSDQLQQVLFNLVLNAIQSLEAGRAQGRIDVAARAHGRDIVISVADNGRGIAPANLERVFEPFFTTKSVGEGTGLGLSISRRLVQRMGGRLELRSRQGEGTTAYLVLPSWQPQEEAASVASDSGPPLQLPDDPQRRLIIAVIDDETALLQAFKRLLGEDHDVVTFADPVEAKEWLLYGPQPDVVLCDIMMPVMNGLELYQEVSRAHPWLAARFVFVTGVTRAREVQQALEAHELRVLEKPLARDELLAVCREVGPRNKLSAA